MKAVWIIYVACVSLLLTRQAETDTAGSRRASLYWPSKIQLLELGLAVSKRENTFCFRLFCGSGIVWNKSRAEQSKEDFNNKHSVIIHSVRMNKLFRNNLKKTLISHWTKFSLFIIYYLTLIDYDSNPLNNWTRQAPDCFSFFSAQYSHRFAPQMTQMNEIICFIDIWKNI